MTTRAQPFAKPSALPLRPLVIAAGLLAVAAFGNAGEIPLEKLEVPAPIAGDVTIREVLPGQIPGVSSEWITIVGPTNYVEPGIDGQEIVWLTLGGKAVFHASGKRFPVEEETIARAPVGVPWTIEVPAGSTLLCVQIRKNVSEADLAEYPKYPAASREPYVRTFRECTAYGEAIKSAKTVSRTLLPKEIVPRMSVGTVETTGPDRVGRHSHPMLEQLFIGLRDNDSAVTADDAKVDFPAFSILHIPIGSMHGSQVEAGKKLYYVWLDFFTTKEGEEWLKMHKPVQETATPPSP